MLETHVLLRVYNFEIEKKYHQIQESGILELTVNEFQS